MRELSIGFAGALFALILQKCVESFLGVQKRKLEHLRALAQLDIALNAFYNASITWKKQLNRFVEKAEKQGKEGMVPAPSV